MPIAKIQLPDGRIAKFEVPEGTTPEQVTQFATQHFTDKKQPSPIEDLSNPTADMSTGQRLAAGAGKAVTDAGLGIKQMLSEVARYSGDEQGATPINDPSMGRSVQAEVDAKRKLDAPLMETGAGKAGNLGGKIALTLPALAVPGANTYAGSAMMGGLMGAAEPTSGDESRLKNTAFGIGGGLGGKYIGDKISSTLSSALQAAKTRLGVMRSQNSIRDSALKSGQDAGYSVPPSQANPSMLNRVIESFPGKAGVGQGSSLKNQGVTNKLAKKALGLPDDAPLTEQSLKALRTEAGKAYEVIKNAPGKLDADQQFYDDIAKLGSDFSEASKEFPDLVKNEAIETLQASLSRKEISPKAAIELVKKLRFDASKNFKSFDDPAKAALGKAQREAANMLDDLIERNLQAANLDKFLGPGSNKGAVEAYKQARQTIAKSYDVEAALNESTGNISAKVLAKALEKGKPLTGELETIARFSRAFPKATQTTEPLSSVLGGTPLDWAMGGMGAATTGNPMLLAAALARPATRAALLSKTGQKLLARPPAYTPGVSQELIDALLKKKLTQQGIAGTGAVGALEASEF